MVHFERTSAFTNRAFAIGLGVLSESARAVVMQVDEAELLQEQNAIKSSYKEFLSEIEQNLAYLSKDQHAGYFQEVIALFLLSSSQFKTANDLAQRLFLQHGTAYQSVALADAKEALRITPLTEEASSQALPLLLIATGGLGYYQQALTEMERQLRLTGGLVKPGANKAMIDVLIKKYAPTVRTPNPVEPNTAHEAITGRLDNLEALTLEALSHLRATSSAPTATPELGGIELAEQITRLSKPRIYALVSKRGIPHSKRGNKLYFNRAELLTWVENGRRDEASQP
ncbi:MAG: helix-turn-helix domain-containing protein [Janthinobacterium lividum]